MVTNESYNDADEEDVSQPLQNHFLLEDIPLGDAHGWSMLKADIKCTLGDRLLEHGHLMRTHI